jgi:hypothetical protein
MGLTPGTHAVRCGTPMASVGCWPTESAHPLTAPNRSSQVVDYPEYRSGMGLERASRPSVA